jgi:hypothetical protein
LASATARRISPGIRSSIAFRRSGRFSVIRTMRGLARSRAYFSVWKRGIVSSGIDAPV